MTDLTCPLCGSRATQETWNEFNDRLQFQDCMSSIECTKCGLRYDSELAGDICGMKTYADLDELWDATLAHEHAREKWESLTTAPTTQPQPRRGDGQ